MLWTVNSIYKNLILSFHCIRNLYSDHGIDSVCKEPATQALKHNFGIQEVMQIAADSHVYL